MKIGDKVRFLFDKGGGTIAAIKGNIVMVEDEDGFQIPTPINEVVADATHDSYSTTRMVDAMRKQEQTSQALKSDGRSMKAMLNDGMNADYMEEPDDDPAMKDISFRKPVEERKGDRKSVV